MLLPLTFDFIYGTHMPNKLHSLRRGVGHPEGHTWRRRDRDTCSHSWAPSARGTGHGAAPTPSPGRHVHVPGATHVPWSHSGLETEEINIFCDIKIPLSYYITDVDLTQIGTKILISSNSDSGTKHHRAGRNTICWCQLSCSKQDYSHALQPGLRCT